jgi:hypothetical protein
MWSVKLVPKPGFARISSRCAVVFAARFFVTANSSGARPVSGSESRRVL